MNIWNKVYLGVIMVAAFAILALAAVELNVRGKGQQYIASLEQKIEKADADIARISAGSAPTKPTTSKSLSELGFDELKNVLHSYYYERGREWRNCIVRDMEEVILPPALPQVRVRLIITGPPDESGIETDAASPEHLKGIVYVFDEGNNGGAFLGRFSIDSATIQPTKFPVTVGDGQREGYQVTLISADTLNSEEIVQIFGAGRSRWAMYLTPPVDRIAGIFDQLTDEEKQAMPEEFRERFQPRPMPELTDEERANASPDVLAIWQQIREQVDDPESDTAESFAVALDWLYLWRSMLLRDIASTETYIATNLTAEEKTKAENEKMTADCVLEEERAEEMTTQRNTVEALLAQYQAEIDRITLQNEKLQTINEAFVAKMAEYQATAVEEIEKRATNAVRNE